MTIRKVKNEEYKLLSDLAIRSKSYWGYSKEFINSFREELSYSIEDLSNPDNHFIVAELDSHIIGFYALIPFERDKYELEALFVDPEFIGQGVGKTLIKDAKSKAISEGVKTIIIQGDPNAEKFYLSVGCKKIGKKESLSIPGRYLPLYSLTL